MKRLGIYLTYDKKNIVDSYIGYMLKELKTCVDDLVVVCNELMVVQGIEILKEYTDKIFYRENIGFDAGGFKDAMCNYIGWDKVYEYDELVLVNDSIFGPFKPMKSIFSEMDNHEADFWGVATHGACGDKMPKHIQSYFLVIRSSMLHSIQYRKYWEDMPYYLTFSEVVYQHEVTFTSYFEALGYSYCVLADTEANDSQIASLNNYMQYAMISYELIKKRNFPFLKKQQIAYDTLAMQTQENLYQAIDYIDKETVYDVNLIWDNIIRTLNLSDLQRSFHLQYIISSQERKLTIKKKVAIVIYANYKVAVEYVLEYLDRVGKELNCLIQVISESDEILGAYRTCMIDSLDLFFKQKCDWTELCHYDYVCILHDTDMSSDVRPSCTGKSYFYCIWENLFKNENHILEILEKFEKEERLGFLAPPQPNFGSYFGNLGDEWDEKYREIEEIVNRLQLNCPISEEKPPFRITDSFWIRGNILKCLREIESNEYIYLPYLWGYFAQHMGYYSGIVESVDYASMNEVNMQYYLKQITTQVKSGYGDYNKFGEMEEKILSGALKIFCEKYSRILIYGTGYYAQKYKKFLLMAEAYVVSDGQKKQDHLEGIPVIYFSEVKNIQECGIILCLNKKNQGQVIPLLEQHAVNDYFCMPC